MYLPMRTAQTESFSSFPAAAPIQNPDPYFLATQGPAGRDMAMKAQAEYVFLVTLDGVHNHEVRMKPNMKDFISQVGPR